MADKILNTRLRLKYDTLANWSTANPVLLEGEVGIVSVPLPSETTVGQVVKPAILFKVGDGTTDFNTLPFASGMAADVYSWAKKEQGVAEDIKVLTEGHTFNGKTVSEALKTLNDNIGARTGTGTSGSISDMINSAIGELDVTDSAKPGEYVSAISQEDGKIVVTRAALPTVTEGTANGTVSFNGTNVNVHGLGSAAYKDEDHFDSKGAAAGVLGSDKDTAEEKTVYGAFAAIKDVKDNVIGTKPAEATSTTVYGYIDEAIAKATDDNSTLAQQVKANTEAIGKAAAEGTEATGLIKATTDNAAAITILNGTVEEDGSIAKAIADAKTDIRGTVTDDYNTLEKIEGKIKGNAISVEIDADGTDTAIKTYTFYAGEKTESNKLVTIDIPKDLVVTSGTVGTATENDKPYVGAQIGDAYIDLVIANQSEHIYIPAKNLVDIYTAAEDATEVQLTVGTNNVISAALVNNGITTAKIANEAVTSDKLSSSIKNSLGKADTAVQTIESGVNNGTIKVDGNEVAVTGLGSAAYAEANSFAASTILDNLDATLKAADVENVSAATDIVNVVTGITQENGKLTAIEATQLAKVASTASAYDLSQATKDINKVGETETEVDCFILYGGSATELVKNYNV